LKELPAWASSQPVKVKIAAATLVRLVRVWYEYDGEARVVLVRGPEYIADLNQRSLRELDYGDLESDLENVGIFFPQAPDVPNKNTVATAANGLDSFRDAACEAIDALRARIKSVEDLHKRVLAAWKAREALKSKVRPVDPHKAKTALTLGEKASRERAAAAGGGGGGGGSEGGGGGVLQKVGGDGGRSEGGGGGVLQKVKAAAAAGGGGGGGGSEGGGGGVLHKVEGDGGGSEGGGGGVAGGGGGGGGKEEGGEGMDEDEEEQPMEEGGGGAEEGGEIVALTMEDEKVRYVSAPPSLALALPPQTH
jgi:hypothetical protein